MVTQNLSKQTRVLFVDDQPAWHNVMKRYMHQNQLDWTADFANIGQEALAMLTLNNYAALVTDWKMPGMNGDELVNLVRHKFPHIAQVVQSTHDLGAFDLQKGDRSIQFFPKGGALSDLVSIVNQGIVL
jgi:CheY-like chemotaxis protein